MAIKLTLILLILRFPQGIVEVWEVMKRGKKRKERRREGGEERKGRRNTCS